MSSSQQQSNKNDKDDNVGDAGVNELTQQVLNQIKTDNSRHETILKSLVVHLHAFIEDVKPTNDEWNTAIDFLTRTGQACTETRQEFILLSDVLGVSSMLVQQQQQQQQQKQQQMKTVAATNNDNIIMGTEATVTGPFHTAAFEMKLGDNIARGNEKDRGELTVVRGIIKDCETNQPISNALIDVWQSDDIGNYDIQDDQQPKHNLRGKFHSNNLGEYWFRTIRPNSYPVPMDGPVGELLSASGRHPMRPSHIHFKITSPGYQPLITHLFDSQDQYLKSDAVFGVKQSLIVEFTKNESKQDGEKYQITSMPFCDVQFDFALEKMQ